MHTGSRSNARYLIEQLIDGKTEYTKAVANASRGKMAEALPSLVVRTSSKGARDALSTDPPHACYKPARGARGHRSSTPCTLVISMSKITELLADEQSAKAHPRALIIKAFEMEHPGHSDVLKQAMEMRALVVVADVRELVEMGG